MAVMASAAAIQNTVNFRVNPAAGTSFKYRTTGTLSVMGMEAKIDYTSKTTIVSVENGVVVSEVSETKGSVDLGGQVMEMPDMGTSKSTVSALGVTTKLEGEMTGPEAWRTAIVQTVTRPEAPVAVGSEWTWTNAADTTKGTRAVEGKYKLVAIEETDGRKLAKIEMDVKETSGADPASAKGTLWADIANGMPFKTEVEIKNMPIPGAPEPISGKMLITLVP
jgi:hypothetical protein